MQLEANDLGKRYNREWIFRHFNYTFATDNTYAVTGANGSGKSTLLQVLAGATDKSEGTVVSRENEITGALSFQSISIAAPYLELVEEMTAMELLNFHSVFKKLALPVNEILSIVQLSWASGKQIRYYSSGMKQRLRLAQAFFSETPVLFLDEPTTNLDTEGIQLYQTLIREYSSGRMVIVCSNDKQEYDFCNALIEMGSFK